MCFHKPYDILQFMKLKRIAPVIEDDYGVCLWRLENKRFIGEGDTFLNMPGKLKDPVVEEKMRKAAVYYMGEKAEKGEPVWIPGARPVTDNEHDDMMERLQDGKTPDIAQSMTQMKRGGLL